MGTSFVDHLSCLCVVFLMLSRLFIAVLWSPVGKEADLLALVGDVYCIFVTLQCDILGQVWKLIVSFPALCVFLPFILVLCNNCAPETSSLLISFFFYSSTHLSSSLVTSPHAIGCSCFNQNILKTMILHII